MRVNFVVLTAIILGVAVHGAEDALANDVSDYRTTVAAIDRVERAGSRLASPEPQGPELADSARIYADVVVTEAALEHLIGQAGKLSQGDVAADLERLAELLEELKAVKAARADLWGRNGTQAQTAAFVRAIAAGSSTVDTAQHLRASLGCIFCEH